MRSFGSALGPVVVSLTLTACFDPSGGGGTSDASTGPSTTEGGPPACVPGALQPCVCPGGMGNQECNAEGTAFGPCECVDSSAETGPADTTGPMTSTGPSDTTGTSTTTLADSTMGLEGSTGPSESTAGATTIGVGETGPNGSSSGGFGPLAIGEECFADADCMTGVCWDFSNYDPLCFGTACSVNCASNVECINAMAAAGAPNPGASSCGADGRCETVGTGFGIYACAAQPR
ncbi:MAG: hypothetical protein AAGF11_08870 [Myxococcota bacterium]